MNETWQVTRLDPNRYVERVNKMHVFLLLMFWLVLTFPALSTGYIPSRDVLIHLQWSSHFSDQFWMGDLYPRWLSGMNNGYGSPVFLYYGPLPYYFTAMLHPFFHADPEGWHQLGVSASLSVLFSGLTAYAWLKALSNESGALLGALLYMSAPYHVACDLYERFAFAELWAFVWLPLILLKVQGIADGQKKCVIGLALSYAALSLTHLPTTMIFAWIPPLYVIVGSKKDAWKGNLGFTLLSMGLGMGLAAFYIIPAMLTQQNVSFADMRIGHFSYIYHFLYGGPRFDKEFTKVVNDQGKYAALMLFSAASTTLLGFWGHEKAGKLQSIFWMAVVLFVLAMMLPIAKPVWDVLPPLQAIQFPWRFNMLLTLASIACVGLGMQIASDRSQGWKMFAMIAIYIFATIPTWRASAIYQIMSNTPGKASIEKIEKQFGSLNKKTLEKARAAKLHLDTPEYRPKWVPANLFSSEGLQKRAASLRELPGNVRAWFARQAQGHERIELDTHAKDASWVAVHQFYYPNWVAHVDNSSDQLPTRPSTLDGRLEVQVPPGDRHVVIRFEPGREERIGQAVSVAALVILLVLAWLLKERKGDAGSHPRNA